MAVAHSWIGPVLVASFAGVLRPTDLAAHTRFIYLDNHIVKARGIIADFSAVEAIDLDTAEVAEFAGMGKDILEIRQERKRGFPLALVTGDPRIRRLVEVHIEHHAAGLYAAEFFAEFIPAKDWMLSRL